MRRRRYRPDTKVWHDPLATKAGRKRAEQTDADEPKREENRPKTAPKRRDAKIAVRPVDEVDAQELERRRLLDRLLVAEGRPSITKAAEAFQSAGFAFPDEQSVWLQILEHQGEEQVADAIAHLGRLLEEEEPERRAVLVSRLRRIEEFADEPATQKAAAALRRRLQSRP
ncbi:MAG: hypothetical protein AAGA56_16455 [Myxococcota bacterium]